MGKEQLKVLLLRDLEHESVLGGAVQRDGDVKLDLVVFGLFGDINDLLVVVTFDHILNSAIVLENVEVFLDVLR